MTELENLTKKLSRYLGLYLYWLILRNAFYEDLPACLLPSGGYLLLNTNIRDMGSE
jgi:hypothetical protein